MSARHSRSETQPSQGLSAADVMHQCDCSISHLGSAARHVRPLDASRDPG